MPSVPCDSCEGFLIGDVHRVWMSERTAVRANTDIGRFMMVAMKRLAAQISLKNLSLGRGAFFRE